MTFPEYAYKRPDLTRLKNKFETLNRNLETVSDETAAVNVIEKINKLPVTIIQNWPSVKYVSAKKTINKWIK